MLPFGQVVLDVALGGRSIAVLYLGLLLMSRQIWVFYTITALLITHGTRLFVSIQGGQSEWRI